MSIKKTTRIKFGIGAAAVAIFSLVIASFSLPVFAKDDAVAKKAILYGVYKTCYMGNKMVSPVRSNEFRDIWSIAKSEGSFVLPTEWYNQYSANCTQLIQNTAINSDFPGITSLTGVSIPGSSAGSDKINSFLTGMGYTKEAGAKGKCATYTYNSSADGSGTAETITMCAGVDSQGRITDDQVTVSYSDSGMAMVEFEIDEPGVVDLDCSQVFGHGGCGEHSFTKGETKFSDLVGAILKDLQDNRSGAVCGPLGCSWHLQPGAPITDQGDVQATFKITSMNDAGDKAVKYLSKNAYANSSALKLTEKERISLLQGYMQDYYRVEIYGCNLKGDDADIAKSAGYIKATTNLKSGSGYQECWVKATKNQSNSVAAFNNSNYFDGTMMTFDKVVKALNKAAKDQTKDNTVVSPTEGGTVEPSADSGEGGDSDGTIPCSDAAAALGWIVCPVIKGLGHAVEGLYANIENKYLTTNAEYVNNSSGTHTAWEEFRRFANIVFAIALIVIILSQVTGFGVNNYGIKKMLPSLIIVAVLVNISFFLCQVAVDLSNIIGGSIKELFDNINVGDPGQWGFGDGGIGDIVSSIVATLLTGAGGFVAAAILVNTAELWILPFLLVLLVTVIGVIFFFILLGVRQAAIIVLITLCPIAIVCYALPNTKKIFERWWKMFVGLLLVYPICGLLMGGGKFASRLSLTAMGGADETSFFSALVAILIQVVPFFFIPSILRSSFQAMGNLGTKISNFGRGLSKTATGAIRKSDSYKDTQERLRGNNAQRMLNRPDWNNRHRILGAPGRLVNRAGAAIRSGDNRISRMAQGSYERRRARRVNAVSAQRMADQNARYVSEEGLEAANRRLNATMVKNYEEGFSSDLAFTNDDDAQRAEYESAVQNVMENPTDQDSIARLRALQNVLSKTDPGRAIIEDTVNHRLYDEQNSARAEGRAATVSDGLRTVGQTIMNDHSGFKGTSRGFYSTLVDMNKASTPGKVFNNGTFEADNIEDGDGNVVGHKNFRNSYYDAKASKSSAVDIGNADDRTLDHLKSSVASMNAKQLANIYRTTSEAITNDNISIKPGNEGKLNEIRQAAYNRMQAEAASSTSYVDNQGRTFTHDGGNNYKYEEEGSPTRNFTRNATTGEFTEVGGAGETISGDNMMTAAENFDSNYGAYRELHANDEFKVSHEPVARKIELPPGWMRDATGAWVDSRSGFRRLTPDEVRRAEQYEAHNIQVDIDNDTRRRRP